MVPPSSDDVDVTLRLGQTPGIDRPHVFAAAALTVDDPPEAL
jgi:hypothetical protein